jgi:hypothetical protein
MTHVFSVHISDATISNGAILLLYNTYSYHYNSQTPSIYVKGRT